MNINKVKAFTLAEMLVVLVVGSIVISMAFFVLNTVRYQIFSAQKNYKKKQELQFFENILSRDFNLNTAFFKGNILTLTNTKGKIEYVFLDTLILREQDTFKIKVSAKKMFLDGLVVIDKTIDAIEISLSKDFNKRQLFFQQTKDASYYLNN